MAKIQGEFGKIRSFLWPIHGYELKKLIPMILLLFFILFTYTVLKDTKDALIVTARDSGAEVIPFLKFWGVLPGAVILMLIYAKLSNKLSKPKLFYVSVVPFIVFFGLFVTVLYPARAHMHPHALCDRLQAALPVGAKGLIAIIRNCTYSAFYVISELWGSFSIPVLYWGFANDITTISESKRFYPLFGLFANFAPIVSGGLVRWASSIRCNLSSEVDPWQISLNYLMGIVVISGLIVLGIYWWINRYVLTDPRFYESDRRVSAEEGEGPKLSLKESLRYLLRSRYLGCIAILVISYGVCINLIETTWISQLRLAYPDPNAYNMFMGRLSQITGGVTMCIMLFFSGNLIRRLGWRKVALVTPGILLFTGMGVFSFVVFKEQLSGFVTHFLGTTPLMVVVVFGAFQSVLSKSSKYSLFDPTKEMAYIPLDQEQRVKGKLLVDVPLSRGGKATSSLLQQGLIMTLGSISAVIPYVGMIVLAVIILWITAIYSLNRRFLAFMRKDKGEEVDGGVLTAQGSASAISSAHVEVTLN